MALEIVQTDALPIMIAQAAIFKCDQRLHFYILARSFIWAIFALQKFLPLPNYVCLAGDIFPILSVTVL